VTAVSIDTALLWPAIAQAALIAVIYGLLGLVRQRAIRAREVSSSDFPPGGEPTGSAAIRRHLGNQFELPVLFFSVVGYLTLIGGVSTFETIVAWLYVLSRVVHSYGALAGPLVLRHSAFTTAFGFVGLLWLSLVLRVAGVA
jgi:hypothetical protein